MIQLTTEQFETILKFLEGYDPDVSNQFVANEFERNFKPDLRGEFTVEVSENFASLTMQDRAKYGVSYAEVTDKHIKRIDPTKIKIEA